MFSNQRRGSAGLGGLIAVALVLIGFVGGTGLLVKVYRDGGAPRSVGGCELICRQGNSPPVKG